DWPFSCEALEPWYVEAGHLSGVAGEDSNPFAPPRSAPYPMPAHVDMYVATIIRDGASRTTFNGGQLSPHKFPAGIASRFYPSDQRDLERPPCNQCGPCSGVGCANHAKGAPPATSVRRALPPRQGPLRVN